MHAFVARVRETQVGVDEKKEEPAKNRGGIINRDLGGHEDGRLCHSDRETGAMVQKLRDESRLMAALVLSRAVVTCLR